MKKIILISAIVYVITVVSTVAVTTFKNKNRIFLSPVGKSRQEQVLAAESPPVTRKIFGFLPFWTLKDVTADKYKDVDIVYYFSLPVKSTGEFDKTDPGWSKLATFPKVGKRQGLTITCMKQDDIAAVISNPQLQKKVMTNTLAVMQKHSLTDLNIDFEYVGAPPQSLTKNYTKFVKAFTEKLHTEIPQSTVSVATLSDAAWKVRMYDIAEIGKVADYVIVMTYDFTRLSSAVSGPVAPLFGKNRFEYDVYSTITDYMKEMPTEKLVMGVPFYGYEWATVDNKPYAFTLNKTGFGMSTIKRTSQTIKDTGSPIMFDDLSKSPWIAYFDQKARSWYQVWFENERSIGLKMDLVNQAELGGMAIWALGYEGDNPAIWGVIKDKIL